MKIVLDFNIAALMNSSEEPNIGPVSKYTTKMYTLRDIMVGEEILHDYSVYTVEYEALGL
jgi:SET domain-containing protein